VNHLLRLAEFDLASIEESPVGFSLGWDASKREDWLSEAPKLIDRIEELHELAEGKEMNREQTRQYNELFPRLVRAARTLEQQISPPRRQDAFRTWKVKFLAGRIRIKIVHRRSQ